MLLPAALATASLAASAGGCGWFGETGSAALSAGSIHQAWAADAMVRIFPSSPAPPLPLLRRGEAGAPHVCMARREHQPLQVAVRPGAALASARLVAKPSSAALVASVSRIVSVEVSIAINAANKTGLYPDALPPQTQGAALQPGTTSAFWVDLACKTNGSYTGVFPLQLRAQQASPS